MLLQNSAPAEYGVSLAHISKWKQTVCSGPRTEPLAYHANYLLKASHKKPVTYINVVCKIGLLRSDLSCQRHDAKPNEGFLSTQIGSK